MGQCARRLAVLAGLLAPSGAYAQLAPVGVPAGVLRVDLDGSVETWDHRWLDGERAPLGTDLSSPAAGSDLLPSLSDADARIGRITGLTGYRLNLGALTTDALADESRGSLGLALGLTRAITIFGNVPLVRARVQTSYALTSTTTTDAGLTPGHRRAGHVLRPVRRFAGDAEPAARRRRLRRRPRAQGPRRVHALGRDRAPRRPLRAPRRSADRLLVRAHRHQHRRHRRHHAPERAPDHARVRLRGRRLQRRCRPFRPSRRRQPISSPPSAIRRDRPRCSWTRPSSPSAATRRRAWRSRWWIAGTGHAVAAAFARRSRASSASRPASWRGPTACSPWAPATGRPTSSSGSPRTSAPAAGASGGRGCTIGSSRRITSCAWPRRRSRSRDSIC